MLWINYNKNIKTIFINIQSNDILVAIIFPYWDVWKNLLLGDKNDIAIHEIIVSIPDLFDIGYLPHGFKPEYENYTLTVDASGNAVIAADYYPGVVRALDTLSQLIVRLPDQHETFVIEYLPIEIKDQPEFGYRGIMVDTAREYFYPDVLKMIIDGMMLGRTNVGPRCFTF